MTNFIKSALIIGSLLVPAASFAGAAAGAGSGSATAPKTGNDVKKPTTPPVVKKPPADTKKPATGAGSGSGSGSKKP